MLEIGQLPDILLYCGTYPFHIAGCMKLLSQFPGDNSPAGASVSGLSQFTASRMEQRERWHVSFILPAHTSCRVYVTHAAISQSHNYSFRGVDDCTFGEL